MELLDRAAVTFQLVLTKADEVKPAALERKHEEVAALARRASGGVSRRGGDQQRNGRGHCRTAGGDRRLPMIPRREGSRFAEKSVRSRAVTLLVRDIRLYPGDLRL